VTTHAATTPVGRAEVAAAVLDAAAQLFAERGPAATSIRDVAARSKVNHGLVFRHFGTKEQLVGAVLDHLAGRITALVDEGAAKEDLQLAVDRHARVVARALLDGYPAGELQTGFPNMAHLLEQVRPRFADDRSARLATANAVALQLGWNLFRPFLSSALELEDIGDDEVTAAVADAVARLCG
jgi:TetR/AcrR family transcriptional regulator, repressor for neighboring sulfatase